MDETEAHHVKQSKPDSEGQRLPAFPHTWKLNLKNIFMCKYICDLIYIYVYTYIYIHIYRKRMGERTHDCNSGFVWGGSRGRQPSEIE
jgi:hypothetical protein